MDSQTASRSFSAHVASHIPGRLRIKLQHGQRASKDLQRIVEKIGAKEGIRGLRSNTAAGSITVQYDRGRFGKNGVFEALKDADVVFGDLSGSGGSVPEKDFEAAVKDLSRHTGMDLGKVIPLALVGAGLLSFARNGLMIEKVPVWFFLWLALDTFVKLRGSH